MNVKLEGTRYVWTAFAVAMAFLLGSTLFGNGGLSVGHVILGIAIAVAALASTAVMWGTDKEHEYGMQMQNSTMEKAKRRNLDAMLSRLSDDELMELRNRLSNRESEEDYALGDDG